MQDVDFGMLDLYSQNLVNFSATPFSRPLLILAIAKSALECSSSLSALQLYPWRSIAVYIGMLGDSRRRCGLESAGEVQKRLGSKSSGLGHAGGAM